MAERRPLVFGDLRALIPRMPCSVEMRKNMADINGEDGFFKVVDRVAENEKKLGIYDLAQLTPKT